MSKLVVGENSQKELERIIDTFEGKIPKPRLTPIKAIRAKCLDYCCGQYSEVRECHITRCALHPYRLGKRPKLDSPLVDNNDHGIDNSLEDDTEE